MFPKLINSFKPRFFGKKIIKDHLRGIDVEKEYALILKKESKLSSKMRKLVLERKESANNEQQ